MRLSGERRTGSWAGPQMSWESSDRRCEAGVAVPALLFVPTLAWFEFPTSTKGGAFLSACSDLRPEGMVGLETVSSQISIKGSDPSLNSSRINEKNTTPKCIIFKPTEEKILRAASEKQCVTYRRTMMWMTGEFSSEARSQKIIK